MKFILTYPGAYDCIYSIQLEKEYTITEFIEEILRTKSNEWGCFAINGETHHGGFRIEYLWGKLKKEIPQKYANALIAEVNSCGGWTQMNYSIRTFKARPLKETK